MKKIMAAGLGVLAARCAVALAVTAVGAERQGIGDEKTITLAVAPKSPVCVGTVLTLTAKLSGGEKDVKVYFRVRGKGATRWEEFDSPKLTNNRGEATATFDTATPPAASGAVPGKIEFQATTKKKAGYKQPSNIVEVTVLEIELLNPSGDPTKSAEAADGVNEFTFDSSTTGYCYIKCEASLNPDTSEPQAWAQKNLVWSITPGISGSTLKWGDYDGTTFTEKDNKGKLVWARFAGLPANHDQFGNKTVKLTSCTTTELTTPIQIFYNKTATNHPGGQAGSPNWFHYWSQATEPQLLGTPKPTWKYEAAGDPYFDPGSTEIVLTDRIETPYSAPLGTHNPLQGIDLFAYAAVHESGHYDIWVSYWGNSVATWNAAKGPGKTGAGEDWDEDDLRNDVEDTNMNGYWDLDADNPPTGDFPGPGDVDTDGDGDLDPLETWNWKAFITMPKPDPRLSNDSDWKICEENKNVTGDHMKDWADHGMQHHTNDTWND